MTIDAILVSQCFGAAALFCACIWPLCCRRRTILLVQSAGSAAMALYFASLGSATAASTCTLSLVQLLLAALIQRQSRLMAAYAATIPLSAWLIAASWNGMPSALATLGAILCSIARLQRETKSMRLVFLCAAPCWVAHDFVTGSAFGLALDAVSIAGNAVGLLRLRQGTPDARAGAAFLLREMLIGRARTRLPMVMQLDLMPLRWRATGRLLALPCSDPFSQAQGAAGAP